MWELKNQLYVVGIVGTRYYSEMHLDVASALASTFWPRLTSLAIIMNKQMTMMNDDVCLQPRQDLHDVDSMKQGREEIRLILQQYDMLDWLIYGTSVTSVWQLCAEAW